MHDIETLKFFYYIYYFHHTNNLNSSNSVGHPLLLRLKACSTQMHSQSPSIDGVQSLSQYALLSTVWTVEHANCFACYSWTVFGGSFNWVQMMPKGAGFTDGYAYNWLHYRSPCPEGSELLVSSPVDLFVICFRLIS